VLSSSALAFRYDWRALHRSLAETSDAIMSPNVVEGKRQTKLNFNKDDVGRRTRGLA
jgi:hypothetical protein